MLLLPSSRDCSVGIATGYGAGRGKIFHFSTASRPALGPTQPPMQWVPGVERQGREADHSPTSGAEMKNSGAVSPFPHIKYRDSITFHLLPSIPLS
jgi:hypothetical protein